MKALVYTAPGSLRYMDWPEPSPRSGEAVLAVEATGICGSDLAGFLGKSSRRVPPMVLGHEVVGRVLSSPPDTLLPVGTRVVANPLQSCGKCPACHSGRENQCDTWTLLGMDAEQGGFAERVAVAASNLTAVDDDLPVELLAMVEPLANTVHVMSLAFAQPFRSMLILGGGTQGSLALMMARRMGVDAVAVAEKDPVRLALANRLGADVCIDPSACSVAETVRRWKPGGVDLVLDAVGAAETRAAAISSVRTGGRVILLGLHDQRSDTDYAHVVRNEITLAGSFAYTRRDFAESLRLLTSRQIDPSPYVEVMSLRDGQSAFERLERGAGATLKLVLVP